jgi:hypothetical protein
MKKSVLILIFFTGLVSYGQKINSNSIIKHLTLVKDSIYLESYSISPFNFKILDNSKKVISKDDYTIDFATSLLLISSKKYPKIWVFYDVLPEFLTKTYKKFDSNLIVPNASDLSKAYRLTQAKRTKEFQPFEGLNSSGSISRSINLGNNQNTGLNSNFDLQISGKLSKDVNLRASITDNNVALQNGGFTQRLNEFDRVFIEMFTDKWRIKAGDVDMQNATTQFLRFTKKVSGLAVEATLKPDRMKASASGAVVKGRFFQYKFNGQESNQGPYRIKGPNGQEFVLIVAGSEVVYVNGVALKRGENNDYVLDYNAAQITFNSTFPITANIRIVIEYQFTDRNFTRFISYESFNYNNDKLQIGAYFYNENDAKNQPVQLSLSDEQKAVLAQSGDTDANMLVPSALSVSFDANKVLYKKTQVDGQTVFEVSNNPLDSLFEVRFSFVGSKKGNYILTRSTINGRVFEYLAPIGGELQGDYSPIIKLVAPDKLQVAVVNTLFKPNKKTTVKSEVAVSNFDKNLFSNLQDADNKGVAAKFNFSQILIDKKWQWSSQLDYEFNSANFKTVERFRNVEFSRDWNVDFSTDVGAQSLLNLGMLLKRDNTQFSYAYKSFSFGESFKANSHIVSVIIDNNNFKASLNSSYLKSESTIQKGRFFRLNSKIVKQFSKMWVGAIFEAESNKQKDTSTDLFLGQSQQFKDLSVFWGLGDSTKVFVKLGINIRENDSIREATLQKVSRSNTYFIKSRLLQNKTGQLNLYANYRQVDNVFLENDVSLNSRVVYSQSLFKNKVRLNTVYETNSGSLAQQEFTYIAVDDGQGFYTWIDYNNNGIQELNEFEVAVFKDQANFVRLFLPDVTFLKTHLNKFSQALVLNPSSWRSQTGLKKSLSHFINQTFVLIENNKLRTGNGFNLNPFDVSSNAVIGLKYSLRNSLFFNRGRQHYSTTYIYTKANNIANLITGSQQSFNRIHQLLFTHKLNKYWLLDIDNSIIDNKNTAESFINRNYQLSEVKLSSKLTYLYNKSTSFDVSYTFDNNKNKDTGLETLQTHKIGMHLQHNSKQKLAIQSGVDMFINNFKGNSNSPVAFQMLKGLQPGTNFTWNFSLQKQISNYLDFNLGYFGRKSQNSKVIHTGTVQLRANF